MKFLEILDSVKSHLTDDDYRHLKEKLENCEDDVTTEVFFDNDHEFVDKLVQLSEFDYGKEGLRYMIQIGNIAVDVDRSMFNDLVTGFCITGLKLRDREKQSDNSVKQGEKDG